MPPRRSPAPKSAQRPANPRRPMPCVAVAMASDQDRTLAAEAVEVLRAFGVGQAWRMLPAVGAPQRAGGVAQEAKGRGVAVGIATGDLVRVIAASTILPAGVAATRTTAHNGVDNLRSTAQTPFGVAVATVEPAADADARLQEAGGAGSSGCPRGEGRR